MLDRQEIEFDHNMELPENVKDKLDLWNKAMNGDAAALIELGELRCLYNSSSSSPLAIE